MQHISGWCDWNFQSSSRLFRLFLSTRHCCSTILELRLSQPLFDKHHVGTLLEYLIRLPTMSQCLPAMGVRGNGCSCVLSQYMLYFHDSFFFLPLIFWFEHPNSGIKKVKIRHSHNNNVLFYFFCVFFFSSERPIVN